MLFQEINWAKGKNLRIQVSIDRRFKNELLAHGSTPAFSPDKHSLEINLLRLIISIGTIHSARRKPTQKQKIEGAAEVLEWITKRKRDFIIHVVNPNPDTKKGISERLGTGIAVEITRSLFKIKYATLETIYRRTVKTPDFQCWSANGKKIVVEAKGTMVRARVNVQMERARLQKRGVTADIKVASSVLLEENIPATCFYNDPLSNHKANPDESRVAAANHYSAVFNFLGQAELSRYFSLMAKRLLKQGQTNFPEFVEKNKTFEDLHTNAPRITNPGDSRAFIGRIDQLNANNYVFNGFAESLLSYSEFKDGPEIFPEGEFSIGQNNFTITEDGICLGEIVDIDALKITDNQRAVIRHSQEYTSINDIDGASGSETEKYLTYLFKKVGYIVSGVQELHGGDFVIRRGDFSAIVEFKKLSHGNQHMKLVRVAHQLRYLKKMFGSVHIVFITNATIRREIQSSSASVTIIDRSILKNVIENPELLLNMFK